VETVVSTMGETTITDKTNNDEKNDSDDVTVMRFSVAPTVPVSAFIATAIMDSFATNPEDLALLTVCCPGDQEESRRPRSSRVTRMSEAAAYVPRWVRSTVVNTRRMTGPTKQGVGMAMNGRVLKHFCQSTNLRKSNACSDCGHLIIATMNALELKAHRHDRDILRYFQSGRCILAEAERNCFHTSPLIAEAKRCS
jgi:hypothetical protein